MANIEKLDELVIWATKEDEKRKQGLPSEWDQARYVKITAADDEIPAHCGTACCLAGKTVMDAGAFPSVDMNTLRYMSKNNIASYEVVSAIYADGTEVVVEKEAKRLLDLTHDQAMELFHGNNKLEHVIDIVQQIKAGSTYPSTDRYSKGH